MHGLALAEHPTDLRVRVIMAKCGLDGHDRGAKVVARGLRDAGFEVIYTGLRQRPEVIARAAVEEDVDVICVSLLSGAHLDVARRLHGALVALGAAEMPVVIGGIIPEEDVEELKRFGVRAVFGPGALLTDITATVRELVVER